MRTTLLAVPLALAMLAACDTPLAPEARALLNPGCLSPAPVLREPDPGLENQYIVVYHAGTNSHETTARLARTYGFTPRHVYETALKGFFAEMSPLAVAGVRCEPEVKYLEGNARAYISG